MEGLARHWATLGLVREPAVSRRAASKAPSSGVPRLRTLTHSAEKALALITQHSTLAAQQIPIDCTVPDCCWPVQTAPAEKRECKRGKRNDRESRQQLRPGASGLSDKVHHAAPACNSGVDTAEKGAFVVKSHPFTTSPRSSVLDARVCSRQLVQQVMPFSSASSTCDNIYYLF